MSALTEDLCALRDRTSGRDDRETLARAANSLSAAPALLSALKLARCICADAFKDSAMEWDDEAMAEIDAAISIAEASQ